MSDAVARALTNNLRLLTSSAPDLPARHRSLAAMLDITLERLDPEARRVYRRLSVFQDGFSREAAELVGGATPQTLQALIGVAVLHRLHDGRYHMHPFVRQHAAAQLRGEVADQAALAERQARTVVAGPAAQEPSHLASGQGRAPP